MKIWILFFTIFLGKMVIAQAQSANTLNVSFFDQKLEVPFDSSMYFNYRFISHDAFFRSYYKQMDSSSFNTMLNYLQVKKEELRLNDWYYFQLIRAVSSQFYAKSKPRNSTFLTWFLLNKSGYNSRIAYYRRKVSLDVFTEQDIMNIPRQVVHEKGYFVDISSYFNNINYDKISFYQLLFYPNMDGVSFDFNLSEMPLIYENSKTKKKVKTYVVDQNNYQFTFRYIKEYELASRKYPELNYLQYSQMAVSKPLLDSLDSHFKPLLRRKDVEKKLRFLLSFVRTGFKYMPDKKFLGSENKAFGIESIFASKYIDDEEYAILYKFLVDRYVGVKTIILTHQYKAAVGVLLPQAIGKPVEHNGELYTFVKTYNIYDDMELGEYGTDMVNLNFEIITEQ